MGLGVLLPVVELLLDTSAGRSSCLVSETSRLIILWKSKVQAPCRTICSIVSQNAVERWLRGPWPEALHSLCASRLRLRIMGGK